VSFTVVPFRGSIVFTRDAWIGDAKLRGGVITLVPAGSIAAGAPAARFGNASPYTYELAPLFVLSADGFDRLIDDLGTSFWSGYEAGEAAGQRIDDTLSDAAAAIVPNAAKVIPWWLWALGGVAAYGALVNAGVVPPLRKLLGGTSGKRT
jgi:hypothetical protein